MYDLHSHLLPAIDDGSPDYETSLAMARVFADQGVLCVACTPHILPGLYHNSGPQIKQAVAELQQRLDEAAIPLRLVTGADNHIAPDFVAGLQRGHLLPIADSRYVLVEPPHHVAPARLEDLFFSILIAGYVPVLTHPERLTWIESKYDVMERLAAQGVWMQITSGSLCGRFGRRPRYWAERMLEEGLVHILATDAHNLTSRPPDLREGFREAQRLAGAEEAQHLVVTRPEGMLNNKLPSELPMPVAVELNGSVHDSGGVHEAATSSMRTRLTDRVRRLFG
jgi:protein-tyrosine phosphatase